LTCLLWCNIVCSMEKPTTKLNGFHLVPVDRKRVGNVMAVGMNAKIGRMHIYQLAYRELERRYGKAVDFVQLFTNKERPNSFWINPCQADAPEKRRVNRVGNSMVIAAKVFFRSLIGSSDNSIQYPAVWDRDVKMLRVDIAKPL
jgi:hypothetical protein